MVKALFDTNIQIDFLNGIPQARDEIARYDQKSISIITWMEVLGDAGEDVETHTRDYRNSFDVIPLDDKVADRAVRLRRQHGVRLPDAIVWASAEIHAALLVTRNTKDFGRDTQESGCRTSCRAVHAASKILPALSVETSAMVVASLCA